MNNDFISPLVTSLHIASIAGIIATLSGTFVAYLMYRFKFKGQFLLEIIFLLPIVLPPSVIGFLLLIGIGVNSPLYPLITFIFGHSIIFTPTAAIIAASVVAFPIMYQAASIAFSNIDQDLIKAAKLDHATNGQILFQIIIPLSVASLLSGAILSFARAFGEFGATLMVAGNIAGKTQTLPITIYNAMALNDRATAGIYVLIMITTSVLFLLLTNKIIKK